MPKYKKIKLQKAFSLIEMSLVILIISLLIVGSVKGANILKKSRYVNAKSLTQNSIVSNLKGLLIWYETSLETSFDKEETLNNGSPVSNWYDNKSSSLKKFHATQSTQTNKPLFYFNVFNNSIPGLRFDGNDFFNFDGTELINSSYTVFIVEQRRTGSGFLAITGGSNTASNSNLILGYRDNNTITQAHYANDMDYGSIPSYTQPQPRMHTFMFNNSYGKKYWLNGGINPDQSNTTQTSAISSYNNPTIGCYAGSSCYNGDIGEIIIIKRSLLRSERMAVESYLSKKYNIPIQ